ncbi:ferric reductase-like transmembrane domain-containing protein [Streptomyces zhihengii]|uniref:ferric reductase-like transmembrane domain-containing protein n=1 Tax=Streptomyces zhihengii TaxID=1818004 RepID=UPI0036BEC560
MEPTREPAQSPSAPVPERVVAPRSGREGPTVTDPAAAAAPAPRSAADGPGRSRTDPGPPGAGRPGPGRITLRSDLRASLPDGLLALLVTAVVFVVIFVRIEAKTSSTLTVMPFMEDTGAFWVYFLSQAFGWSALLWAWGTVVLGLLLSGPRPGWIRLSGPSLERLHRTTSLNTIALIFAHALLFAVELIRHDKSAWYARAWTAFVESFVPGGYDSGTGATAIPIGQAALYLAIPLGLLFYVRHRFGPKTWRILHRFVIVVYVLSVWHTLLYGTNVWYDGWFRNTVWLLQLPIAALFLVRLMKPARRSERLGAPAGSPALWSLRATGRAAAALVLIALVTVMVTGRDGGRTVPPADTSSSHNHD